MSLSTTTNISALMNFMMLIIFIFQYFAEDEASWLVIFTLIFWSMLQNIIAIVWRYDYLDFKEKMYY